MEGEVGEVDWWGLGGGGEVGKRGEDKKVKGKKGVEKNEEGEKSVEVFGVKKLNEGREKCGCVIFV